MTTTVKHKGSVREWEGSVENWDKHRDVIVAWCDGSDIQVLGGHYKRPSYIDLMNPAFESDSQYRIKQREPNAGEVWIEEEGPCLITDENTVVSFDGTLAANNSWPNDRVLRDLKYSAPSVRAYFMREVMEQWEHQHKNLDSFTVWLKEQCEME